MASPNRVHIDIWLGIAARRSQQKTVTARILRVSPTSMDAINVTNPRLDGKARHQIKDTKRNCALTGHLQSCVSGDAIRSLPTQKDDLDDIARSRRF